MESILARVTATILGLLALAGAVAGGYAAYQSHLAGRVNTDIAMFITNARGAFASGSNGYTNMTAANLSSLITAGIFPESMVNGTTVTDAWGNTVTPSSANSGTQGVVTFGGGGSESATSCAKAAQNIKGFVSLKVGSTTFTPAAPPDAVTAATACNTGLTFVLTWQ